MRTLILINGAQEHRPFYGAVGADLERRGHEVHYALDSHFTDVAHPESPLNGNRHYFSEYFKANAGRITPPQQLEGANLSLMAFPDLDRFTHTIARGRREPAWFHALCANLGHFFVDLFERYDFDSVVYENVSNSFSYFAAEVARRRKARFIGFACSRLPGRTDVVDRAWARDSRLVNTYHEVRNGSREVPADVKAWVDDYIGNFQYKQPDYMKGHPFEATLVKRYFKKKPLERMFRSIRYYVEQPADAEWSYQQPNPFIAYTEQFAREAARNAKAKVLLRSYYESEIDLDVPYFAYPLQFHPESSTSVDGPAFIDEWSNIQGIAQNLPAGYSLYVKDHKHALARQSMAFYRRVRRLPNVVLVSPYYDTKRLIRNAKAVVCSTSTFGFEALVLRRPVFVLGHPFYDFFAGCKRVTTFDGAHELFSNHESMVPSEEDVRALVTAYHLTSEEGRLDLLSMYDDPGVAKWIAGLVERKTNERPGDSSECVPSS